MRIIVKNLVLAYAYHDLSMKKEQNRELQALFDNLIWKRIQVARQLVEKLMLNVSELMLLFMSWRVCDCVHEHTRRQVRRW